jgi:hypothetical protein
MADLSRVETALSGEVEVAEGSGNGKVGGANQAREPVVGAPGELDVEQQTEPLFKREFTVARLSQLLLKGGAHPAEAQLGELVEKRLNVHEKGLLLHW